MQSATSGGSEDATGRSSAAKREGLNPFESPREGQIAPRSFIDRFGIYPPLVWGYVGLLFFMIGDGVEQGYLSKYLVDRDIFTKENVAIVFTAYGITVAIAAWLSGALSDLWRGIRPRNLATPAL